ncbi:hypothetical protein Lal_00020111 [Lupinus albus]|nr:hypothetical protein Lal_00020111 [Lupinus albus]
MATSLSFNITFSFYYFLFLFLLNFQHSKQQQQQTPYHDLNDTLIAAKSPAPLGKTSSSFKPGVAVVVAVLTTMFSLTFLLLLYIKHCNNVPNHHNNITTSYRKNSGIDRSVIESLPIFRFRSLMGQKHGLDCAVCLNKFEPSEVLRLLPKCKHAFHVECVDTWLEAHSTCPLCRYRVDPEDIFLLHHDTKIPHQNEEHVVDIEKETNPSSKVVEDSEKTRRISGRHSSVEKGGIFQNIPELKTASFFRRSLDSARGRKKNENGVVGERKDEMLMLLEQRNIVCLRSRDERWSDVEPLDMLYLTSEMIISEREQGL